MIPFAGRFVGPLVLDKLVKFDDPGFNRSRENPPEAVGGGSFDCFSPITSDLDNDVISGTAVDDGANNI